MEGVKRRKEGRAGRKEEGDDDRGAGPGEGLDESGALSASISHRAPGFLTFFFASAGNPLTAFTVSGCADLSTVNIPLAPRMGV